VLRIPFRRTHKTASLSRGFIATVVDTVTPLQLARIIYGDGVDKHDTVFSLESHDGKFRMIGTYNQLMTFSDAISARMMEWIYENDSAAWLGYPPATDKGKGAGNGS
jgi:hypothetical protein